VPGFSAAIFLRSLAERSDSQSGTTSGTEGYQVSEVPKSMGMGSTIGKPGKRANVMEFIADL